MFAMIRISSRSAARNRFVVLTVAGYVRLGVVQDWLVETERRDRRDERDEVEHPKADRKLPR